MVVNMLPIFDLDGTLISSCMDTSDRDFNNWHVLPGRVERLQQLRREGHRMAIASNQAGVAFGFVSERAVLEKLQRVLVALCLVDGSGYHVLGTGRAIIGSGDNAIPVFSTARAEDDRSDAWMTIHICYGHLKSRDPRYRGSAVTRRKPGPAMLYEAMDAHGAAPEQTLFIGDMESDEQAALAASVPYVDANTFFAEDV
jgi:D-glycero-D-manno-heptose 1,7-bisphosphate phosphatase